MTLTPNNYHMPMNILRVHDIFMYNLAIWLFRHMSDRFSISIIPSSSLLSTNNTVFASKQKFLLSQTHTNYETNYSF